MDAAEARESGRVAVQLAVSGDVDGSVAIRRLPGKKYAVRYDRVLLRQVAKNTRHMPDEFIAKNGHDVTKAFLDYARPLVGELPPVGFVSDKYRVPKAGEAAKKAAPAKVPAKAAPAKKPAKAAKKA